jgi:hypothetical protein
MTELTATIWQEIERNAVMHDGQKRIGLGILRNIFARSRRTNPQNDLLWALYGDVLRQGGEMLGGWTKDDLHEFALGSYFGWDKYEAFGMKKVKPKKRSSRLAKSEFSSFVEHFVMQMAQHGIMLKLPGDLMREAG